MDVIAYFVLLLLLIWFYGKMFTEHTFVAGLISGFAAIITMVSFVNAYHVFGFNGFIFVCVVMGILYYFVVLRRLSR